MYLIPTRFSGIVLPVLFMVPVQSCVLPTTSSFETAEQIRAMETV